MYSSGHHQRMAQRVRRPLYSAAAACPARLACRGVSNVATHRGGGRCLLHRVEQSAASLYTAHARRHCVHNDNARTATRSGLSVGRAVRHRARAGAVPLYPLVLLFSLLGLSTARSCTPSTCQESRSVMRRLASCAICAGQPMRAWPLRSIACVRSARQWATKARCSMRWRRCRPLTASQRTVRSTKSRRRQTRMRTTLPPPWRVSLRPAAQSHSAHARRGGAALVCYQRRASRPAG